MNNYASPIPLQDLIRGVLKTAEEKMEKDDEEKSKKPDFFAKKEDKKEDKKDKDDDKEKSASLTDADYVEKLASAVDYINENWVKEAETVSPAVPAGDLEVTKSLSGPPPPHKSTKPAANKDAANAAGEALTDGGLKSKTQIANDYNDVPGGPSGYPEKGPLVNGPRVQKSASGSVRDQYILAIEKEAGRMDSVRKAGKSVADWVKAPAKTYAETRAGKWGRPQKILSSLRHAASKNKAQVGLAAGAAGAGVASAAYAAKKDKKAGILGGAAMQNSPLRSASRSAMSFVDKQGTKEAKRAGQMRQAILRKLAGEDVFPANIISPRDASPLVGGGELKVDDATQPRSAPTGYGNAEGRSSIKSNNAAMNYTKGTAKAPQKKQLKEVLEEPALSPKTDPVLRDSWQNADKAGVKIAMERARILLLKVAEEGTPEQKERLHATLVKAGQMGGSQMGMTSASPPPSSTTSLAADDEGNGKCTCGDAGDCRVCRLKAALSNSKKSDK